MKKNTEAQDAKSNLADAVENGYIFLSSFRKIAARSLTSLDITAGLERECLLAEVARAMTRDQSSSPTVVVGAIPFAPQSRPALFLARELVDCSDICGAEATASLQAAQSIFSSPTPETYMRGVKQALDLFKSGKLEKVVLARTLDIDLAAQIDLPGLIAGLAFNNPHAFTFSVPREPRPAAGRFVGASPELLVRKVGDKVMTNPLAGSIRRGATPDEDQANAQKLLASVKDRHEHAIVVEAVEHALRPYCTSLSVPAEPSLIQTPTVWHLSTSIIGELANPAVSSLELALALHPTPAVCGHPTETAFAAIAEIEDFDRGLYAGLVGWADMSGDGEWAVAIRCAEIHGRQVRLFAGAGIVPDSNAEAELAETSAKLRTMLSALGIEERHFDQVVTRQYAAAPATLS